MHILVIQTAFVGDVVLTTPFLRALNEKWPEAKIHFVTTKPGCEILRGLEYVEPHILDKKNLFSGLRQIQKKLTDYEFDVVYSVHRSLRSLWLGKKLKAKKRIAFSSLFSTLLGYKTVPYPKYSENMHYSDKPLKLLQDSKLKASKPVLATIAEDETSLAGKLSFKKYIVISPFSVWGTKMWLSDRFADLGVELSKKYKLPIVLIGANKMEEVITGEELAQGIEREGGEALSLVGKTSLGELKVVLKNASVLVSNDSAPVHVAAAFDIPTVAIFGPTVKKWGFFPTSSKYEVVERSNVDCRPCSLHGPQTCPKKHFRCMKEIEVSEVFEKVLKVLG